MVNIPPGIEQDVSKFKTELAFVRLHWAQLSAVVIAATIVGVVIGKLVL